MRPSWMRSRWLMQRRKVVLPDPDGPMRTTTSLRRTVRSTPLRTCSAAEVLVDVGRLDDDAVRRAPATRRWHPAGRAAREGHRRRGRSSDAAPRMPRSRQPLAQADALSLPTRVPAAVRSGLDRCPTGRQQQVPDGRGDEQLERMEDGRAAGVLAREGHVQLGHADDDQQRGRLQHVVELVAERRNDDPRRLRQDDATHRLAIGHAE